MSQSDFHRSGSLHQQALDLHGQAWDFMREVERRDGRDSDLYPVAREAMLAANRCIGLALAVENRARKAGRQTVRDAMGETWAKGEN